MNTQKNDLFDYGLYIYQNKDFFKFSLDSILLAEFVEIKNDNQIIVDFCTGNAPVPMILSTKCKCIMYGVEIQNSVYNLAKMSIAANKLQNQIKLINDNLKNILEYLLPESVDIVTCNPPYFKCSKGTLISDSLEKAIARHEIETNLEEIVMAANYILKNKGSFYIIHRAERLEDIIRIFQKNKFCIKKMSFIYTDFQKNAVLVVIKATKNGQSTVKIGKPVLVSNRKTYKNIFRG